MRLFLAINLPDETRQAAWDAAAPLRQVHAPVRWVRADCVHLTLKFLGEVSPDREPSIRDGVDAAVGGNREFVLPIGGFGVFPSASRPRVVWIGCERMPALEILQHDVERRMESLGFPLEVRAFRPHLTLGRATRGARGPDFKGLIARLDATAFSAETTVESVDLMESVNAPGGVRYQVRHEARLAR